MEKLTGLKGLRGSGLASKTSICTIYHDLPGLRAGADLVLLDTPGIDGTETSRTDRFYNFKLIADFLRRKEITRFKIAYFESPNNPRGFAKSDLTTFVLDYCFREIASVDQDEVLVRRQLGDLLSVETSALLISVVRSEGKSPFAAQVKKLEKADNEVCWQNDLPDWTQKSEYFEAQSQRLLQVLANTEEINFELQEDLHIRQLENFLTALETPVLSVERLEAPIRAILALLERVESLDPRSEERKEVFAQLEKSRVFLVLTPELRDRLLNLAAGNPRFLKYVYALPKHPLEMFRIQLSYLRHYASAE